MNDEQVTPRLRTFRPPGFDAPVLVIDRWPNALPVTGTTLAVEAARELGFAGVLVFPCAVEVPDDEPHGDRPYEPRPGVTAARANLLTAAREVVDFYGPPGTDSRIMRLKAAMDTVSRLTGGPGS